VGLQPKAVMGRSVAVAERRFEAAKDHSRHNRDMAGQYYRHSVADIAQPDANAVLSSTLANLIGMAAFTILIGTGPLCDSMVADCGQKKAPTG
jgi:hypothetical protein